MSTYVHPKYVPIKTLAQAVHCDPDDLDTLYRRGLIRGRREFLTGPLEIEVESYLEYRMARQAAGDVARDGAKAYAEAARDRGTYGNVPLGRDVGSLFSGKR